MLNPDTRIVVHDFLKEERKNSPGGCLLLCISDGLVCMYSNSSISVPRKAQPSISVSLFFTSTNDRQLRNRMAAGEGGLQHANLRLRAPWYAEFLTKMLLT